MKKRALVFMAIGTILILFALALVMQNVLEENHANQAAEDIYARLQSQIENNSLENNDQAQADTVLVDYPLDAATVRELLTDKDMETIEVDGNTYIGYLDVPDLGLTLPVISEWSYDALKIAPARFSEPGVSHGLIIAGHSYSRHFGNLSSLTAGAVVYFTDIKGTVYSFEVTEIQTLAPTDVKAMVTGDYDLTLFTCTPGGENRVTVRCSFAGSREV